MNSRLIMFVTWLLGFGISLVVVIGLDLFRLRAGPGATGNDLKIVFGVFAPYLTTMTVFFVTRPSATLPPQWNSRPTLVAILTSFFFNAIMVGLYVSLIFIELVPPTPPATLKPGETLATDWLNTWATFATGMTCITGPSIGYYFSKT